MRGDGKEAGYRLSRIILPDLHILTSFREIPYIGGASRGFSGGLVRIFPDCSFAL
jgi:hypothetical protein